MRVPETININRILRYALHTQHSKSCDAVQMESAIGPLFELQAMIFTPW